MVATQEIPHCRETSNNAYLWWHMAISVLYKLPEQVNIRRELILAYSAEMNNHLIAKKRQEVLFTGASRNVFSSEHVDTEEYRTQEVEKISNLTQYDKVHKLGITFYATTK